MVVAHGDHSELLELVHPLLLGFLYQLGQDLRLVVRVSPGRSFIQDGSVPLLVDAHLVLQLRLEGNSL